MKKVYNLRARYWSILHTILATPVQQQTSKQTIIVMNGVKRVKIMLGDVRGVTFPITSAEHLTRSFLAVTFAVC